MKKENIRIAFLNVLSFFLRNIHTSKKKHIELVSLQSPVIADIDYDTWILTMQFLEDLDNVYVEIINDEGETVYYESVETALSNEIRILLTYEIVGNYQLSVIGNDKPLYVEMFELY